ALFAIQPGKDRVSRTRLERFVEYPQRRNACCQIAGREIASVELAALYHGQQVRRLMALRDDAVRHPDAQCSVGAAGDTLAEGVEASRVDRSGRLIAGKEQFEHALCMAECRPSCH